nr:ABC transporter ATP-binding protein [Candidatus Njordarchaeum guaymaensis]
MQPSLLSVDALTVDYPTASGTIRAVEKASFSMDYSEILGLVGESGSGKSTLGLSLVRLTPPPGRIVAGSVHLKEIDILALREQEMRGVRGSRISYVFQDPMMSLNPVMRVGDHFVELIRTHDPRISKEEALQRARKVLSSIRIQPERVDDYPHQLSGGMRQRVMIGLAITLNPSLVIADEPTTALDVIVQSKILDLLQGLRDQFKMSLILITHDLSIVLERCDRVAVMYAGQLVEYASAMELGKDPKHPYTQGLIRSIPNIELKDQKLKAITGSPPSMVDLPKGCHFWPRCPHVMKVCRERDPVIVEVGKGHLVRCFLYGGE